MNYLIRLVRFLFVLFLIPFFCISASAQFSSAGLGSPFDEQSPRWSASASTVYYTVTGHPGNAGGKRDPGDIWSVTWNGTSWSAPVPQTQWNNAGWNAVVGMSQDGSEIYLSGHYRSDGSPAASQGIAVCRKSGQGWSAPVNIYIPYLINKSSGTGAWVDDQSGVFIYSASTPATGGGEDLFVSLRGSDEWSEPVRLGGAVNSSAQEWSPALSSDGRTLYFASNRPGGAGSFDLYQCSRLDDSWTSWSDPQPVVGINNTAGRDLFPSPDAAGFWYTSTLNSEGYGDIRLLPSGTPPIPPVEPVAVVVPGPPQRKEPEVAKANVRRFSGSVISEDGGPVSSARMELRPGGKGWNADAQGRFAADIPLDSAFEVEVEAEGFVGQVVAVPKGTAPFTIDVRLQPVKVGALVKLPNVLFRQGTDELMAGSFAELDMVVRFMKTNPTVRISLAGHTDGRGSPRLNKNLSAQRVRKVKAYLVSQGIGSKRIEGKGFGGTRPVADSRTEAGRRLNRRVEFSILSK